MKRFTVGAFIIGCLLATVGESRAQFKKLGESIIKKAPGADRILKKQPAITTGFHDAVYTVPFLDDFNPKDFIPADSLERTSDGFLVLHPGLYQFDIASFCLKSGTYAPRKGIGEGYLYAPIKGPRAGIVSNIVRRSFDHPEIDQGEIQELLWAVISYAKLSDMSQRRQIIASKLLTPKELLELNGGALGMVSEKVLEEALSSMPEAVSRVLRAEARIRDLISQAESTYEDLEKVAVLSGDPPDPNVENVPPGRWSFRPEGFFVRHFPESYKDVRVEIYIPEFFSITIDELGRITSVSDEEGHFIQSAYEAAVEPATVPGDPQLRGYAFRSIRFGRSDPAAPEGKLQANWDQVGWTFVGVPEGKGVPAPPISARFPALQERYQEAKEHKAQLDMLDRQFVPRGTQEMILKLGHYAMAMREAVGFEEATGRLARHLEMLKKAWQFAVWIREMYSENATQDGEFVANDAVPPSPERQRLQLKWLFKQYGFHNFPGFPFTPRPFRRPMLLMGPVR